MQKSCVICGKVATTREHAIARCFFEKPHPSDMITVPSCSSCNNSYSLDEEYVMYLIDYLKSIEENNGDFTRIKPELSFIHKNGLEDRMIKLIQMNSQIETCFFKEENDRVSRVLTKTAICLFAHSKNRVFVPSQLKVTFRFKSQMSDDQIRAADSQFGNSQQEGYVKYYCNDQEVGLCLSEFLYAAISII